MFTYKQNRIRNMYGEYTEKKTTIIQKIRRKNVKRRRICCYSRDCHMIYVFLSFTICCLLFVVAVVGVFVVIIIIINLVVVVAANDNLDVVVSIELLCFLFATAIILFVPFYELRLREMNFLLVPWTWWNFITLNIVRRSVRIKCYVLLSLLMYVYVDVHVLFTVIRSLIHKLW